MGDFIFRVKTHFSFSKEEQKQFFITCLIVAFILFSGFLLRKWDISVSNIPELAVQYSGSFIFVVASLFVHIAAQKLFAIKLGYTATYSYWLNGLFIGVIMAFFSYGYIPIILAGTIVLEHNVRLRLGRFRYGLNYKDLAKVSFAGAFANILFILLMKPIVTLSSSPALNEMATNIIWINVLLAAYAMLPFKNTDGLNIFLSSRIAYTFCVSFVLIYGLLVLSSGIFSLVFTAFLALLVSWIFLTIVDKPR